MTRPGGGEVAVARRLPERWTRLVVGAACGLALAALAVSSAFAEGGHARITLGTNSASPGAAIQGAGSGFSPTGSAVQISFNSVDGPTLWTGRPAGNGTVSFSFTVPNAPPGSYPIVATQSLEDGSPAPGTPARTTLVVAAATPAPTPEASLVPTQPAQVAPAPHADPPAATPAPPDPTAAPADPTAAPADPTTAPADPTAAATPSPSPAPAFSGVRPRPPQVSTLWRVGGADPSWITGFAVSTAISQTTSPLVPLGAGVAIACSTLATAMTLRRRSDSIRQSLG